jgi:hypothetical protein
LSAPARFVIVTFRERRIDSADPVCSPRPIQGPEDLMPRRRTILSIIRTVVYGCLTVFLALWHGEVKGVPDAILAGAIAGDYLTWLVWSVIELPDDLLHGCYDACVNTLFGLLVYRLGNIGLRADVNGELLGVMFLAFLLMIGIKIFYLSVLYVEKELEDD